MNIKSILVGVLIGVVSVIFIALVLASFLYPVISGFHYWVFVAPKIQGPIAPVWSWGKNWCSYKIFQEKVPVEELSSDCLYLLEQ
jgi:hypothetical protein